MKSMDPSSICRNICRNYAALVIEQATQLPRGTTKLYPVREGWQVDVILRGPAALSEL